MASGFLAVGVVSYRLLQTPLWKLKLVVGWNQSKVSTLARKTLAD